MQLNLSPRARGGWFTGLGAGVGLQFLAATPAALLQSLREFGDPLYALPGLPVLAAGRSVVSVFEASVERVCGDRSDTMLSNAWWFLCLATVQLLAIAALIAWRRRRADAWLEPVTVVVLALVAVNALLAADWPWWGT